MNKILKTDKKQCYIPILTCTLLLLLFSIVFKVILSKDGIVVWAMSTQFIALLLSIIMVITISKHITNILSILSAKLNLILFALAVFIVFNILRISPIAARYRLLEPTLLVIPIIFTICSFSQQSFRKKMIVLSSIFLFSVFICYFIKAYLQWLIISISYIILIVMQIRTNVHSNKNILYIIIGIVSFILLFAVLGDYFQYNEYSSIQADPYIKESIDTLLNTVKWIGEGVPSYLQENSYLELLVATRFGFLYIASKYGLLFVFPIVFIYFIFYSYIIIDIKKEASTYFKTLKGMVLLLLAVQSIAYLIANMGVPIFYYNSMPLLFNDALTTLINTFLVCLLFVNNQEIKSQTI